MNGLALLLEWRGWEGKKEGKREDKIVGKRVVRSEGKKGNKSESTRDHMKREVGGALGLITDSIEFC